MRTTLNIPDELLETAKSVAHHRRVSLSTVVSECLREKFLPPVNDEGVELNPPEPGFPFWTFPKTGNVIRSEDVRRAIEEEGAEEYLDLQRHLDAEAAKTPL